MRLLVTLLLLAVSLLMAPEAPIAQAQNGCGLQPLPPLPPLGCRAMEPVCQCDYTGRNCRWEFRCVR